MRSIAWLLLLLPIVVIYQCLQIVPVFPEEFYERRSVDPCAPRRFRLAQAGNENSSTGCRLSMTLTFHLSPQCLSKPTVYYGNDEQQEGIIFPDEPLQFNYTSDTHPELFVSDWIYHVELKDIQTGGVEYWYRVTVGDKVLSSRRSLVGQHAALVESRRSRLISSETYSFRSPPKRGEPTTLALVGDLGQTLNSIQTMYNVWKISDDPSQRVSQLLIAGDLSYADSEPERWLSWMDWMEPALRSIPLHMAAGNHEIECDTKGNVFVPYENYFKAPNRIKEADMKPVSDDYRKTLWKQSCSTPSTFQGHYDYGNSFYSFEHGLAKVIVLNSYTNSSQGSPQYQWLEQELQQTDRALFPWLLVTFHAPLQTTFMGHVDEIEATTMRDAMEPLFVTYKVNLILSGHDHAYMRTYPLVHGKRDPTGRGPVYLTLGAGGNREGHPWGYRNFWKEDWVAKRDITEFGYGHLHIPNATHALFHWIFDKKTPNGIRDVVWFENQLLKIE